MTIKSWIIITVNSLLLTVVLVLSFSFYNQFKIALNERVLLQLTSIKRLKRLQIEDYINREWEYFLSDSVVNPLNIDGNSNINEFKLTVSLDTSSYSTGVYDLTHLNPDGHLLLGLFDYRSSPPKVKILRHSRVQEILLERTGMGKSGETYLVGSDYKLRSQSRFFPDRTPYSITATTKGVMNAFENNPGHDIIQDYRGISVFSAYGKIQYQNFSWVILSEIDEEEALKPLELLKEKLLMIVLGISSIAILISIILTRYFTKPLARMRNQLLTMSNGNYYLDGVTKNYPLEIQDMFRALDELKKSLAGAVDFSVHIGDMALDKSYSPSSQHDLLGASLVKMRDKLTEYRNNELSNELKTKKIVFEGQELERKRHAMELHDGIGPLLTSLKLYVQANLKDGNVKNELKQSLDNTIQEVRMISYALMPAGLDFGVSHALQGFVDFIRKTKEIDIQFEDFIHQSDSMISSQLGINIYRICQELINNSIRHADCKKIRITLSEFEEYVSLYYFDDGKGFDISNYSSGTGIIHIKERLKIFDGTMKMKSKQGKTVFEIEIPLHHE